MIATLDSNIESFVAADMAAKFLCITRRRVLEMARAGEIPPIPSVGASANNGASGCPNLQMR